jgi:CheY-like chemotaxis protein
MLALVSKSPVFMMCMSAQNELGAPGAMHPLPGILFIEDDPNDALLLLRSLKRVCGEIPVQRVSHGAEAVAYLQGDGAYSDRGTYPLPSMLIMDLKMPVMGGLEVLTWLRNHPTFSALPVIVLSGSARQNDIQQARDLRVETYIVKPFDLEDWRQIARQVGERWLGANGHGFPRQ